ncbi:sporulation integral membrane protein YtvI [Alkalihalobacillus sp. 1P02AB]|uniref:sporulation integral membrane protein YtvI n=1 Tax=Alkalihalobacillus sp. 1P02AB TaxID=3132260 RepID=UPI0039A7345F
MTRQHAWMALRAVLLAVAIFIIGWLFIKLFSITYPFWFAALFAWFLQPFVRFLQEKLRLTSGFASLFGLLGGVLIISSIITGIVFLLIYSFRNFFMQFPEWIEMASVGIQNFFNNVVFPFWQEALGIFNSFSIEEQEALKQSILQLGTQLGALLGQLGQGIVDRFTHLLLGLPTFFVAFLFFLLSIYFMGKSWAQYQTFFKKTIPYAVRLRAKDFNAAIKNRLFGFIRAQFIIMAVTAFIVMIGLTILGVDYVFTLSVVIGIAELLPYLGTGTILIPWFIYLFIAGDVSLGIGLAVLYAIIVIIRQLLEPKVLSSSLDLNPVAVLISFFAGLQVFGAIGLFIGPVVLVLVIILHDIKVTHDIGRFIRDGFST